MQYILRPLDPEREPVVFDTDSIIDLARLGRYDADGVVYFDGIGYHEPTVPQPDPDPDVTLAELARELAAVKAERDKYRATLATIAAHEARPGTAFYTVIKFAKLTIAAAKGD